MDKKRTAIFRSNATEAEWCDATSSASSVFYIILRQPSYPTLIFTHLTLCLAAAMRNVKYVKICLI